MDYKVAKLNQENLVKQYTPLVKYIASRVILEKNKNLEYEDIVGYGYIGLMEAIKTYDPSKGAKFSTYATLKIKGAIIDELRNSKIISRRSASKVAEYYKAIEALQKNLLREPTDKEIKEFKEKSEEYEISFK